MIVTVILRSPECIYHFFQGLKKQKQNKTSFNQPNQDGGIDLPCKRSGEDNNALVPNWAIWLVLQILLANVYFYLQYFVCDMLLRGKNEHFEIMNLRLCQDELGSGCASNK